MSFVIVNSAKGQHIFNKIAQETNFSPIDIDKALKKNISAIQSAGINPKRTDFFDNLNEKTFKKKINKLCSLGFMATVKNRIKHMFNQFK